MSGLQIAHVLSATALLSVVGACVPASSSRSVPATDTVVQWRVPDGGRLPHAVIDDEGTTHLVYVRGEPVEGDLMYVTRGPGETTWSEPVQVNSEPGTVTGIGPIDGGHLAQGRDNRLHVTWFRINPVEFFYTRTRSVGQGFEPQFGVASGTGAEAGSTLAADDDGNVFMFWHDGGGEDAHRSVYVTVSHDDGLTWEPARPVSAEGEGACACCNLRTSSDPQSVVRVSYRGARENVHRGQRLLTSRDGGQTFADELIQPWELGACPVSTTALAEGPTGTIVAWETVGQVYFANTTDLANAVSPTGNAGSRRKNPTVAVNHRGETLLAWADGPGIRSGGTLDWQLFDANRQAVTAPSGGQDTIEDGSVAVALARPDGTFAIVH